MIGLEKTKAAHGEVSQSARVMEVSVMHRLYDVTIGASANKNQVRQGALCYVSDSSCSFTYSNGDN